MFSLLVLAFVTVPNADAFLMMVRPAPRCCCAPDAPRAEAAGTRCSTDPMSLLLSSLSLALATVHFSIELDFASLYGRGGSLLLSLYLSFLYFDDRRSSQRHFGAFLFFDLTFAG